VGESVEMVEIKTALISVSDKTGLDKLVKTLDKYNVKIISSGGTAQKIRELGHKEVTDVSDYTGFPESPGGYVKTLHPKIHGGLLLNEKNPDHLKFMEENGIEPIDMVVVNLYPFEKTVAKKGIKEEEAFEQIDIGGPAMVRAAAKGALLNERLAVITDPAQYDKIIIEMNKISGRISQYTVLQLAHTAFKRTAEYDGSIVDYLDEILKPYMEKKYESDYNGRD
jgi:phosphoribosylaminoimidazolecarboxamide formyltransferase/IMP cyclohydrolase